MAGREGSWIHSPVVKVGIVEDCPNISAVAAAQADYMRTVGLDYLLFDHTNFNE
jgi:hypothetical protein